MYTHINEIFQELYIESELSFRNIPTKYVVLHITTYFAPQFSSTPFGELQNSMSTNIHTSIHISLYTCQPISGHIGNVAHAVRTIQIQMDTSMIICE